MRARGVALALLLVAAVLAGCSSYGGDGPRQVQQWATDAPFGADSATIEQDLGNLANGLTEHQLKALQTACDAFYIDVDTLYTTLPTPDPTLTNELNDALTTWTLASQDCSTAPSFTSAKFARYRAELQRADAAFAKAKARLATFGVK